MKRLCALSIVTGLLAVAGCARHDSGPRRLRLAVIPKGLDIPVFNYAKVGAERAAAQLGNVDVIWRGPERADELRQKEILESFITQRVDGIAISVLNADFLTSTIDRAVEAGIPVVTWDSDAPRSKRLAFYGVDDYKSGQIMGEEAARLLDGNGTIAIITSLGAWISVGGWPVFTRNALAAVDPARTKVISFDTIPPAPEILKAGKAQVLLGQKYFGWGSESVKLLTGIIAGRPPQQPIIDSGVDVVTPANVDAYLEEWARLER